MGGEEGVILCVSYFEVLTWYNLIFSCPEQLYKYSCPSVRQSVRRLVRPSVMFVKKWRLEYQKVIKTYRYIYLWDTSDSSDSSDSCDSRDISVISDSSESSYQTTLWQTFCD